MNKAHGRENDTVEVVGEVVKSDVALREEAMQAFWREHDIFNKTVETPAGKAPEGDKMNAEGREGALGHFVFYDGPPFATGLPHYGHILASTIKDAIPRFWTMNGYRVERKWGWDCHGLPLENLIEKKLGLGTKRDIEDYGVKNFNEAARDAVLEYADDWRRIIPRMGRFVDMENDYKTMDSTYTESVWWVFKSLHDKGLVYEGFKSMHLCPRCGTTLSNFEVNQGYKDIKDIAVTVKLPLLDDVGNSTDTSLLVWTTTPWTLPGNTAAAVHNEIEYVVVEVEGEKFVLAKGRLAQLGDHEHKVLSEMKGSELVGKKYLPPFNYLKEKITEGADKAWTIYHADYVEEGEEGTGAVHIAPAYGDDDMKLAQEHDVPIVHHVDEAGHFMDFVTDFAGQLVKPKDDEASGVDHKDADIEILKHLQATGKIFKKENITHSYPHCWRCETPLLNYATTSWFVEVTKIKSELVEANSKVKWVPEHVGTNRFGKWLEGARDWAISRQRYWGAPLPIWRNPETKEYKVFGSLAELQSHVPKSDNQYFLMRHGEAESNLSRLVSTDINQVDELTEKGIKQVKEAAEKMKAAGIDLIVTSPFHRTKRTTEIIKETLGLDDSQIIEDVRMQEMQTSEGLQGKNWSEHTDVYGGFAEQFEMSVEGQLENRIDVQKRTGELLYDIEQKYQGKKVLFVGHVSSTFAMYCVANGADIETALKLKETFWLGNAEVRQMKFVPMPHNDTYALDFHRPYIDEIDLYEGGVKLERVPDVFDCWFESGSMPYASQHYLGEPQANFDPSNGVSFPANFIAEGLDQTRGWFYSLTVLGVALFGKSPFENVIVNGLVLAEDGKKMSKSLQNYPDPMELSSRTGVDAMRFYLLSSPVIRGEDLNFSEKEVNELQRKNIGRLHNVLQMYEMFKDDEVGAGDNSSNVLDEWIVARLNQVVLEVTSGYQNYELDKATRPITDLIDDISVWYLRRSRDRLKGEDIEDKNLALATLRYTLRTLALIIAPSMPFYAEYLWQKVKETTDAESVHLGKWPERKEFDTHVLDSMALTREIVTAALEARTKANIKVRQPIASVSGPTVSEAMQEVILDELNAKEYQISEAIGVDTNLTEDLLAEGAVRELMRAVQGKRKTEGLEPHDRIELQIQTTESGAEAISAYKELLIKTVGAEANLLKITTFGESNGELVSIGDYSFTFIIKKL